MFASQRQKIEFNAFRRRYIRSILTRFCKAHGCTPTPVGSPPTSAMSNADFNLTSTHGGNRVVSLIRSVHRLHGKTFVQPLDVVFDVNVYGTNADAISARIGPGKDIPGRAAQKSQRAWALMRAASFLTAAESARLSPEDRDAIHLCSLKNIDEDGDYASDLSLYFVELARAGGSLGRLAEAFSRSKYHERETYRSVGAVLHIVNKRRDISPSMAVDSAFDNFGFVLEVMRGSHRCVPWPYRVARASKYVARMCDAMAIAATPHDRLHGLCEALNAKRKRMDRSISVSDVRPVMEALGVSPTAWTDFPMAVYDALLRARPTPKNSSISR
jgi:hypothetical protein